MKSQIIKTNQIPENVVEWNYLRPEHSLSNDQVWSTAQDIFKEYGELRKNYTMEDSRLILQNKYEEFSKPSCFERLFLMITSDTMTPQKMHLVKRLVDIRNLTDNGTISEQQAYQLALETAAFAKKSP